MYAAQNYLEVTGSSSGGNFAINIYSESPYIDRQTLYDTCTKSLHEFLLVYSLKGQFVDRKSAKFM